MKKTIILLTLILLCSCQNIQTEQGGQLPDVQTGTQALEIYFETPSTNIYMCQQANLITTIRNLGTYDVQKAYVNMIVEHQILQPLTQTSKEFEIKGKSPYFPQGATIKDLTSFKSLTLPKQINSYASQMILQACYPYKTKADFQACIDPDILNTQLSKVCTPQPLTFAGGQGAPVAITQIDQLMMPEYDKVKPVFIIHLQNLGMGDVIQEEGIQNVCTGTGQAITPKPLVKVKAKLGTKDLKCTEQIELTSQDPTINCESKEKYERGQSAFNSVLTIELSYGYVNRQGIQYTITRLPGQDRCP